MVPRNPDSLLYPVLALSLSLNLTAIWWGLPSRYGWAVDELHPRVILSGIETRFSGDWHQPAYPPFHYYLLASSYLPVLALAPVDPLSVEGHTLFFLVGRILSVSMAAGVVVLLYRLGREVFDAASGLFASLSMALSAPLVYYAKTANLEVPLLFWFLLSAFLFLRVARRGELRDYLAFTLSAVLAMGTKDQAYAFYVLPLAALFLHRARREGSPLGVLLDRRTLLSLLVGVVSFLALHNVFFNFEGFLHHFEEILWARSHYGRFEGTFVEQVGMLRQTLSHLGFTLGWPLLAAAALGILLAFRDERTRGEAVWLSLFGISYYVFFIAPVLSTWLRYGLPLAALLAIAAGSGCAFLWTYRAWARAAVVALCLYSLGRAVSVDALLLRDSRYQAESWLRAHVKPQEIVGYMGPEYYLPRLDSFEARRLRPTESVLERETPDFLVVNPEYAARFESGTREHELFSRLETGRTSYARVQAVGSTAPGPLLDFAGVLDNLAKIGPPIEIYQRTR